MFAFPSTLPLQDTFPAPHAVTDVRLLQQHIETQSLAPTRPDTFPVQNVFDSFLQVVWNQPMTEQLEYVVAAQHMFAVGEDGRR
jgi:hypothetical protein